MENDKSATKTVPVEPSDAMMNVGMNELFILDCRNAMTRSSREKATLVYKAMLAAAPASQSSPERCPTCRSSDRKHYETACWVTHDGWHSQPVAGMRVVENSAQPPDRAYVMQNGEMVGAVVNLQPVAEPATPPQAGREPIYQWIYQNPPGFEGQTLYVDVDKAHYDLRMPNHKRIVYSAPHATPPVAESAGEDAAAIADAMSEVLSLRRDDALARGNTIAALTLGRQAQTADDIAAAIRKATPQSPSQEGREAVYQVKRWHGKYWHWCDADKASYDSRLEDDRRTLYAHTAPGDVSRDPTDIMLKTAVKKCAHMVDKRFANSWNLYSLIWETMYAAMLEKSDDGERHE